MSTSIAPPPDDLWSRLTARLGTFFTAREEVRGYIISGFVIAATLLGSVGVWAAATDIGGAVLASGMVVVDNSTKKVQHPTGGVVGEILVKEGARVEAGQVLIRLDETVTKANLSLVTRQLDEIAIRKARLTAEIDGSDTLSFPPDIEARTSEPHIAESLKTEKALFTSRYTGRLRQTGQLNERILQLRQQAEGIEAQARARREELDLAGKERDALNKLEGQRLVNIAKITVARRTVAQLEGSLAEVISQGAQVRAKVAETELQILELEQNIKTEAAKELREQQGRVAELAERRIAAEDQLKRVDIRAPQSGLVHQLSVHTVGGVIGPAEPLLMVVPIDERLVVEARVAPHDIDQIKTGAKGRIRFSAFNQRTTPEFSATVKRISADLVVEQQGASRSGAPVAVPQGAPAYYTIRLEIDDPSKLAGLTLLPGMPAEVHISTQERTALSYFAKPLTDQFARAFKER